jgi:2,6-dihydroxypseudooxynicotine hydrolase
MTAADPRVRAAVDHWAPRFIAMGVDYNDFVRTTRRIERWEDWLDAWVALADEHLELAEDAESAGRGRSAGEAYLHAAICLHFAKFVWVLDAAAHRGATERAIASMAKAHSFLDPTAERIEATLGEGTLAATLRRPRAERPLAANLRRPSAERPPLVVLIPGLDSTKEEFFHWENAFLERGMATLSMDGPGQGEAGFTLPIRHDYEVAVAAMLDVLGRRADAALDGADGGVDGADAGLDLERIGAAGVSLGGYYAPRAAAFEPRIRAVAGVSGSYNFGEVWDQLPPLTREAFTVKSGAHDEDEARAHAEALNLAGVLGGLTQPALYVTGGLDRIIPWRQTERAARETPNGTFVLYEEGTHVCSNIPYRYRPLVADWMAEQLASVR